MNNTLLELLGFSIHIAIIAFALGSILKQKFTASGVLLVIIGVTSRLIRIGWIDSLIAGSMFETLLFFCSTLILYNARISKKIITFCLILFALIITDFLAYITLNALYGYQPSDMASLVFPSIPSMIIGNVTLAIVVLLILNVWRFATNSVDQNQMSLFMFFPVSQIYLLQILFFASTYYGNLALITVFIISVILCVLADAGLIIAMKRLTHLSLLKEKLAFFEKHLDIQLSYYKQLSEYNQNIKKYKHDLKNQLQTIYTLLDKRDIQNAKKYADELAISIDGSAATPFCENLVVDALLQNKYSAAKDSNIKMELAVQLGNDTGIDDLHLCSVISNLIDNALEACNNISDPKILPHITVMCYEKAAFLIIKVTNSKQNEILLSRGKRILSTKQDSLKHGLGLTIVENITHQYSGEFRIHHTDHEFEAIAAFSLKPRQESLTDNKEELSLIKTPV
jgi:signal transduction histidine kinase